MEARSEQLVAEFKALVSDIQKSQAIQAAQLQQLTSGSLISRLEVPAVASQLPPALILSHDERSSSCSPAYASVVTSAAPPSIRGQHQGQGHDQELPSTPQYRMSRAVKTVVRLWHEWEIGFIGSPSLQALDSKWGSRWRAGRRSELQWYSLILEVIKEIRWVAQAQRIDEEAAMWQVNLQQEKMGCSLDQPCKRLRAGRKG